MRRNPFLSKTYKWNHPLKNRQDEATVQLQILHYLKGLGAVVGKTKTMGVKRNGKWCLDPYTFLGFPDITFFYQNKLYFCEVKSPTKGRQTEHQKLFQQECKKANIPYILARSLEDVQEVIK